MTVSILVWVSRSLCVFCCRPLFWCLSLSPSVFRSVPLSVIMCLSASPTALPRPPSPCVCLSLSEPLTLLGSPQANVRAQGCPVASTSGITAGDRLCQVRAALVTPRPAPGAGVPGGLQPIFTQHLLRVPSPPPDSAHTHTQSPPLKSACPGCESGATQSFVGTLWQELPHTHTPWEFTGLLKAPHSYRGSSVDDTGYNHLRTGVSHRLENPKGRSLCQRGQACSGQD